eukprot:GHVT01047577.1.p1 GENE.GHVT01047577.1~~GHVT01047577.1.p1  ORF type:complete len:125 (+),score=7.33 GHVT01047577.1:392-766(+)
MWASIFPYVMASAALSAVAAGIVKCCGRNIQTRNVTEYPRKRRSEQEMSNERLPKHRCIRKTTIELSPGSKRIDLGVETTENPEFKSPEATRISDVASPLKRTMSSPEDKPEIDCSSRATSEHH